MKYEDFLPILVLLIYVALVFVKHRKIKSDVRKKAEPIGAPRGDSPEAAPQKPAARPDRPPRKPIATPAAGIDRAAPKPPASFDRPAPKLLSLMGARVKRFFAEMEQQFREELEKARTQGQESESPVYQIFDYQGEPIELGPGEPVPEPAPTPTPEPAPVVHPVAHVPPGKPCKARHGSRCFRDQSRSRRKIRNAVVWSEILEPPLALRQGKRPWEL